MGAFSGIPISPVIRTIVYWGLYWGPYLGGQGDWVSRLIVEINGLTIWVKGVSNLLTKSP